MIPHIYLHGSPGVTCGVPTLLISWLRTQEFRSRGPYTLCPELGTWSIGGPLAWAETYDLLQGMEKAFLRSCELVEKEALSWRARPRRPLAHCICLTFHHWSQILPLLSAQGSCICLIGYL